MLFLARDLLFKFNFQIFCFRLHPADLQRPLQPDPAAGSGGAGGNKLPGQQQRARHLPAGQPALLCRHRVSHHDHHQCDAIIPRHRVNHHHGHHALLPSHRVNHDHDHECFFPRHRVSHHDNHQGDTIITRRRVYHHQSDDLSGLLPCHLVSQLLIIIVMIFLSSSS